MWFSLDDICGVVSPSPHVNPWTLLYILSLLFSSRGEWESSLDGCLPSSEHQPSIAQKGNFYVFVNKTCSYDVQMFSAPFDCDLLLLGHISLYKQTLLSQNSCPEYRHKFIGPVLTPGFIQLVLVCSVYLASIFLSSQKSSLTITVSKLSTLSLGYFYFFSKLTCVPLKNIIIFKMVNHFDCPTF